MRNRIQTTLAVALIIASSLHAQVSNKKITGQSFTGSVVVNATPQAVWAALTDAQKLSQIVGLEYAGGPKKMEKVGDNIRVKSYGDDLTLAVVHSKPASELRFALDPDNGSYICQTRWTLAPAGNGTTVKLEERYTESGTQSEADIAAQVKNYNDALSRLKTKLESKS